MMTRTTTITSTTKSSTTIIALDKSPSTICSGFIDINGIWNNGFVCPMQSFIQYFCCDTNTYHYCCSPDHYISEINSHHEQTYISGQYQPSNHTIVNQSHSNSFINNSKIIDKQFEQFQKIFIPIFLLSSSILFLIGIAIWFWLYKHKTFYATEQDNFNKQNRTPSRSSQSMFNNFLTKKEGNIHSTMERDFRQVSYSSTEV
ncbi:unnamed protein product [Rotaria sp. Silwood2]|nr:unnamed protein product [Rotaria sp. Silwood2]CAF2837058.1 unnamed protein product [Rotaria sp. Silwood2]CAF2999535.1 unnamed protein product [Rotaria sp. Silwood2]CAF4012797.1 unnamed protein product [Rotaria sp. Silwood2]CAF4234466.1 unnamed protein product [Rotaria sp. Silwood2]